MDLGVLLESPQGSPSSSRVGACTCAFLPSCSSSVTLPFAWIKGSVAFPRGFPTRLFHEAFPQGCPTCHRGVSRSSDSKSTQCWENRFPWNGLSHLGDSRNGGRTLEFLSPFLWRAPPLEMRPNSGNSFLSTQGKDPSVELGGGNGAPLDVGGTLCFLSSGDGYFGELLELQKGVKDPLEVPEVRCE